MKLKFIAFFLIILNIDSNCQIIDSIKIFDPNDNLVELGFIKNDKIQNRREHYEYDALGRVVKEYVTDTLGQIQPRIGLAEILTYEYIDSSDVTTKIIRHFDEKMNPVNNDMAFFHRLDFTTNNNGQELERKYYRINGEIIDWIRTKYNSEGLEIRIEYLNDFGTLRNEGLAFIEVDYDSLGRVIEERSFSSDSTKFHSNRTPYLKKITYVGNVECIKYFDDQMEEIRTGRTTICDTIPDFSGLNSEGKRINITQLKGKVVIVHFWTTAFTAGDRQLSDIVELRDEYKDQQIEIFSVAVEQNDSRWWNVSQANGVDWEFNLYDDRFQDSEVVEQFSPSLPVTYIINEEGLMVGHHIQNIGKVKRAMRQLMNK